MISNWKAVRDVAMLERRLISVNIYFVMLNLSFESHTVLWALDEQKFFVLIFLDQRRYVRCLWFPLANKSFKLNFSLRNAEYWSTMRVHLTYFVARVKIDTIPKRYSTSRSANLFSEVLHVVSSNLTKSWRLSCRILSARFLALMSTPSCLWRQKHVF